MIAKHPRVALLLVTVGDLSGSGGTERHFASLFEHLRRQTPGRVSLITAAPGERTLRRYFPEKAAARSEALADAAVAD